MVLAKKVAFAEYGDDQRRVECELTGVLVTIDDAHLILAWAYFCSGRCGARATPFFGTLFSAAKSSMIENARQWEIGNAPSCIAPWWVVFCVFCLPPARGAATAISQATRKT